MQISQNNKQFHIQTPESLVPSPLHEVTRQLYYMHGYFRGIVRDPCLFRGKVSLSDKLDHTMHINRSVLSRMKLP